MLHLPRIMLAAPASGSGKTMITCGLLEVFQEQGLRPASFKCGPDYIDPMFHSRIIGTPSRNLDTFFTDAAVTRYLFARTAKEAGISVLEGVMGFYDGLGGKSVRASSYELASVTDTPVILTVNARGMSLSVIPLIRGYADYQKCFDKQVLRGVILNQTTESTYRLLKDEIEKQTGIRPCGYVPRLADAAVESRHLGLVTPGEIADLKERISRLGSALKESLDLDAILALADEAPDYEELPAEKEMLSLAVRAMGEVTEGETDGTPRGFVALHETDGPSPACVLPGVTGIRVSDRPTPDESGVPGCPSASHSKTAVSSVRIAVARDEAFCFYYEDNLELLRFLGAEIVFFSPLRDRALPAGTCGLLLGGGYPELYAGQLSENTEMSAAIRQAIQEGLPYLAECGGFMYLHEFMEDMEGHAWPVCGALSGRVYRTEKAGRFGYITLTARGETKNHQTDSPGYAGLSKPENRPAAETEDGPAQLLPPGEAIRGHEFHYFDSTDSGSDFLAQKPLSRRSWPCMHVTGHSAAGFPHLYYWSDPLFAARFLERARVFSGRQKQLFESRKSPEICGSECN